MTEAVSDSRRRHPGELVILVAGLASSTNHSDSFRPRSMFDHSAVFADMDASSRKTLTARSRYHGFANRSTALCRSVASVDDALRE